MDILTQIVICDTNVWYGIAQKKIEDSMLCSKSLIGVFVSAYEFSTSPNLFKKYGLLRNAVLAYNEKASYFIEETPIEYIKKVSGLSFKQNDGYYAFKNLETIIEVDRPEPYIDILKERQDKIHKIETEANQLLIDIKNDFIKRINENYGKKKGEYKRKMKVRENRYEHLETTKVVVSDLIGETQLNWSALELFLLTFDEWLFQLSTDPGLRFSPNDWYDLFHLVYVQPESYYWTFDKKKTKKFIMSSGCGHYLVDYPS